MDALLQWNALSSTGLFGAIFGVFDKLGGLAKATANLIGLVPAPAKK